MHTHTRAHIRAIQTYLRTYIFLKGTIFPYIVFTVFHRVYKKKERKKKNKRKGKIIIKIKMKKDTLRIIIIFSFLNALLCTLA
jgi:hypothetical protein